MRRNSLYQQIVTVLLCVAAVWTNACKSSSGNKPPSSAQQSAATNTADANAYPAKPPASTVPFASGKSFPVQSAQAFWVECDTGGEAQIHECLDARAQESHLALKEAEKFTLNTLSRWNEDRHWKIRAKANFVASERAFALYRDAHCDYVWSLSIAGDGTPSMEHSACIAKLNGWRAKQLRDLAPDDLQLQSTPTAPSQTSVNDLPPLSADVPDIGFDLPLSAQITIGKLDSDGTALGATCMKVGYSLTAGQVRSMFRTYHKLREGEEQDHYAYPGCSIRGTITVNGESFSWEANPGNTLETDWPDRVSITLGGKYTDDPSRR